MTPKKLFIALLACVCLGVIAAGAIVYFAETMLQERSQKVVELKLRSRELDEQQTAYRLAKTDVEKYNYLTEIITSAVPQDKDQARTVRELFQMATEAGIGLKSVTFPASTLGTKAAPKPAETPAAGADASAPAAPKTPPVTQAKSVDGLSGVYAVETVVAPYADGTKYIVTYEQLIKFLQNIESNRRAMQVTSLQITPMGDSPTQDGINFTLTLNIFIKP